MNKSESTKPMVRVSHSSAMAVHLMR